MGLQGEWVYVSLCLIHRRSVLQRPIYDLLGSVVAARFQIEGIKQEVLDEMAAGFRPTHRGHAWSREMFEAVESASIALEVCFDLLKGLQFPETLPSRLADAKLKMRQSLPPA